MRINVPPRRLFCLSLLYVVLLMLSSLSVVALLLGVSLTRSGKISDTIGEIGNIAWQLLISTTASPQARFDILYDIIKDIQDTCQPLKTAKLKNDENNSAYYDGIAKRQKLFKLNNNYRSYRTCKQSYIFIPLKLTINLIC
jgi:hypothetical protein